MIEPVIVDDSQPGSRAYELPPGPVSLADLIAFVESIAGREAVVHGATLLTVEVPDAPR